ncbi:MAG: response regulator [Gemmatimonadota bacterium]
MNETTPGSGAADAPIRVLLVDDHAVLRSGLRLLLDAQSDIQVVGDASTGEEGVEKARELDPDVVVMDISMPGMGGLAATRAIAKPEHGLDERRPAVLVLTMHAEEEYLLPVLDAGGSGYVSKRRADEDLIEAIREVAGGEVFLYPSGTALLLRGYQQAGESDEPDPLDVLSEREREVLALTAEGFSAAEAGKKLYLSPHTVETYRSRLMKKLGLTHRSELVRFAIRTGLLTADPP